MKRRNLVFNEADKGVQRERDPIPWKYCLMTLVCGAVLVLGFFWAARLHFTAMDLGFKNAKLRQQKDDLQSEQKRLRLEKEKSLSPMEIEKLAREMGLQKIANQSIEYLGLEKTAVKDSAEKPKIMAFRKAKSEPEKEEKDKKSKDKEDREKESEKDKSDKERHEENRKNDKKGEKSSK